MVINPTEPIVVAVEFDGVCVKDGLESDCPNAVIVLKKLINSGHKIVLFTIRSGDSLEKAKEWFDRYNIPLWGVQERPDGSDTSPKVNADLYIDTASLGAIVTAEQFNGQIVGTPYIDWVIAEDFLTKLGILKN